MTATKARTIEESALEMAKRFQLVDSEGQVWCMTCGDHPGTLPSLECEGCRDKRIRGWR